MAPILYSFRRCPYAMRARMAIAASGHFCELREVVLRDKPAAMLEASPKGTVPVLVLPDGRVIDQSLDIMEWALHQQDPFDWLPEYSAARAHIADCDGPFKHHLDRYKYPNRYQLADGTNDRDGGAAFLLQLEEVLKRTPYLHGPHFGFADAAIAPFVRQFAHTDAQWFASQSWPHLQVWLTNFETSTLFATVMHKYEPWAPHHAITSFPSAIGNNL